MRYRVIATGEPTDLGVGLMAFVSSGVVGFTDIYGKNHLIFFPSRFNKDPLIQGLHYVVEGTNIKLVERLPEAFGNARDIKLIQNAWGLVESFIVADTGLEYGDKPWPLGDIYKFNISQVGNLSGEKISSFKAFNHNLALSDFNGDGHPDIVVQIMRQIDNPEHTQYEAMTAYVSSENGYDLADLKFDRAGGVVWGGGAVVFADIDGDGTDELIQASYGQPEEETWKWGVIRAFDIDKQAKLTFKYSVDPKSAALSMGVSDLIASDWDLDGDLDILAIFEGRHPDINSDWSGTAFQFFKNADGILLLESEYILRSREYPQREAVLIDVNFDGRPDVVRQTLTDGQFKNLVYLNTKEGFIPSSPFIELPTDSSEHLFTRVTDLNSFGPTLVSFYENDEGIFPILWSIETASTVKLTLGSPKSVVFGGDGDDSFQVDWNSAGSKIFGGEGIDSVYVAALKADFHIAANQNLARIVTVTGPADYQLLLNGIERLIFSDFGIAFDTDSASGVAYRIYKSVFDRTPDTTGLGYWIAQMDKGMDVVEVAARFIDSPEFRQLYGSNVSNAAFITNVYNNVLDRNPDDVGLAWWVNEMKTNPSKTWQKVLADFSESAENKTNVASLIANGIAYDPWE